MSEKNGIQAELTYIPGTSSVISNSNTKPLSTASFVPGAKDVQEVSNPVYLSQFSIFTQDFTLGFQNSMGQMLKDNSGNVLDEYFSVRATGEMGLDTSNLGGISKAGYYQLAILSDDGSVLSIADSSGKYSTLINNDGTHSNRFECATTMAYIKPGDRIPFQLNYYQGPRVRISMMLFARLVDPSNPASMQDPLCDNSAGGTTEGDTYFFTEAPTTLKPLATVNYSDATAGSTKGILNRGWQVIPAANFFIANQQTNPCATTN